MRAACVCASLLASACATKEAEQPVVADPPAEPAEAALPATTVDGPCAAMLGGAGFVNMPITSASRVIVADITATPSNGVVVGLSRGAAATYGALAAAVRFQNGVIEARDGETYRADALLAYENGTSVDVRIIADLASQTYSVMTTEVVIARGYQMTGGASELDTLATIAANGDAQICGASEAPEVVFQRPGAHSVVADANVISDGATTTRVGANGEIVATYPHGGELAVDASGNVYLARVASTTLTVDALTPSFALRWSRTYDAPSGARATAVAVTAAGDINIVLATAGALSLRSLAADGTPRFVRDLDAAVAVPNVTGFALARAANGSVTVEQFDRDGEPAWSRTWANDVTVDQIASSPAGQVVVGGTYEGTITFGGAAFEQRPPNTAGKVLNAYVVALSPAGQHVFSQRFGEERVTAIATNGTRTVIAADHDVIGPLMTTRYTFDQTGEVLDWREGLAGFGWFGPTYRLALSTSNRVFWSYGPAWPDNFTAWPQLVAY